MAEVKQGTCKRYSCACGFFQSERRREFTGKYCDICHKRPYLNIPTAPPDLSATTPAGENSPISVINSSFEVSSDRSNSPLVNLNRFNILSPDGRNLSTEVATKTETSSAPFSWCNNTTTAPCTVEDQATTSSRSRSVDRFAVQQLLDDPPPYEPTTDSGRSNSSNRDSRISGIRRSGSEIPSSPRAARLAMPPPSYEAAQNLNPPSYEEALASSLSDLSTSQGLAALIATTPDLRSSLTTSTGRHNSIFATRSSFFDSQRAVQRVTQSETHRRAAQRRAQVDREREEDLGEEMVRDLQVARYCGCSKCQSLYYKYDSAFPLETQVIMREVLADGLGYCSLM